MTTHGGISNNSGIVQTFNGSFEFRKGATAGSSLNVFNNTGLISFYGGVRFAVRPAPAALHSSTILALALISL